MNRLTRQGAIGAFCKSCIADDASGGTWREQVGACPAIDCALWPYRPISTNSPDWLAARDPEQLPDGWGSLSMDAAIRRARAGIDAKASREAVQRNAQDRSTDPLPTHGVTA